MLACILAIRRRGCWASFSFDSARSAVREQFRHDRITIHPDKTKTSSLKQRPNIGRAQKEQMIWVLKAGNSGQSIRTDVAHIAGLKNQDSLCRKSFPRELKLGNRIRKMARHITVV